MRQRASIGALLLVGVGVVLGATVFRSDIAQATGLAQSVTVNNTPAQAVPVREQNLDASNIRVHEEGTAQVQPAAANASDWFGQNKPGLGDEHIFSAGPILASLITIDLDSQVVDVNFRDGETKVVLDFPGPLSVFGQGAHYVLPLTQPLQIDRWAVVCGTQAGCGLTVNVVGIAAS
jgi:hypothetical protein